MSKCTKLLSFAAVVLLVACAERAPAPLDDSGLTVTTFPAPVPVPINTAGQLPVEEFFRAPSLNEVQISPDGKSLALLRTWKGHLNVFVRTLAPDAPERQLTFVKDRDVTGLHWKGNSYVLFEREKVGGDENFHLYAVQVATGEVRDLTPFQGVKAQLLDLLSESSDNQVLAIINKKNRELFDVYRLNVENGQERMVAENKYRIRNWLVDHLGRVRGGISSDGVHSTFYFEKSPGKDLVPLFEFDFRQFFSPVSFAKDNEHIFALSNLERDLISVVNWDPNSPPKTAKPLFSNAHYDLTDATYSRVHQALGSLMLITDRRETVFLNADDQKDWDDLLSRSQAGGLILASVSHDERRWVVKTLSDRSRGEYFLFDRDSRDLKSLGQSSPWLAPESLAETKTIHFTSRDGLPLEGYLTRSAASLGQRDIPLVLHPHGGPWARDEWTYNPEVQFLANRGYAVLQINYRGSTSYGRKFWEASFKQWGQKMQEDLIDGVLFVLRDSAFNPKRVAIYGASYGGYSTLQNLTTHPDLFACGVDNVGMNDLFTFLNTLPPFFKPYLDMMYEMVGDPHKDQALLTAASPVFHVDRIRAPVLIAQGGIDPRVPKAETDQMVESLRKRGVPVDYMVKSDEGHGFKLEENRFDFYRAMDKFLAKHLAAGGHK